LDFDASDLHWLTEILRSHQEAIEQLETLPPERRGSLTAELARRQLVLGSEGFAELVEMMSAHGKDMARYREEKDAMAPETLNELERSMTARITLMREKIASIRFLLDSI
jgi:hypothetical protein